MAEDKPRAGHRPNRWRKAVEVIRSLNLLPPAGTRTNGIACKPGGGGYVPRDPRKSRLRALIEPVLGPWLYRYWDAAQRMTLWSEWLSQEVLLELEHWKRSVSRRSISASGARRHQRRPSAAAVS